MFENINEVEALIGRLIDKLDASKTDTIELEINSVKIKLGKHSHPPKPPMGGDMHHHMPHHIPHHMPSGVPDNGNVQAAAAIAPVQNTEAQVSELHTVNAPLIGVAYAASSPDAAPFVKVGDLVKKGDIICIIEAMKVMNEIEADKDGEVAEILFENGKMVEYGEPLISLK